ncbi:MAG: YdcF family protein [Alphaproteobacteria bacterium]|nr:YdcF family protein [Alphaproteobacteria bacterium]
MSRIINFIIMAFLTLGTLWGIGFIWFAVSVATMTPPQTQASAIIVLTGGDNRIRTGIDLLLNDKGQNLFISGVNKQTRLGDLIALRPALAKKSTCCVTLGYAAENTKENAQETADWVRKNKVQSLLLVTSAYHMHRAKLEFNRHIGDIDITSYPVVTEGETWRTEKFWRLVFEEYSKTLLVWLNLGSDHQDKS